MPGSRPARPTATARLAMQFADLDKQNHAARFGMWVFLGSEVLLFAGLFALYATYRAMYGGDFSAGAAHNNLAIGTGNTVILITSSLFVVLAVHAVRVEAPRRAGFWLLAAVGLGLVFLTLKGVEYGQHFHEGIYPGDSYRFTELPTWGARMFFNLYFLSTGLHALHVTAGMVVLLWTAWGCFRGRYGAAYHTPVELGGLYWHLVDIVWIFLWPMLYLMHG